MLDRDAVARFPQHDFRLKQDSSYNRESVTPEAPKMEPTGWFANRDFNNGSKQTGRFIRTEENDGRTEWVIMEDEGPGAIVRSWMPWRNQKSGETTTILRIYVDGASEPVIEGNQFELFQGKGMIPFPLAHESLRSAVSFFPIPYAKSCKVTVSELPFFYQFTYREYQDEVAVKSFTMDDFEAAAPLVEEVCKTLLHPKAEASGKTVRFRKTLAPDAEKSLKLPRGVAAVRELSVKLGSYEDPEVMRKVVLKMSFDGKDTVWCPLGDFFGSGIGLNPFQGWFRTVAEDGSLRARWVMPYRKSATVSVVNLSDEAVSVELEATVGDWQWDERSMYFHAEWRGQYPVPTRPFSDWNYVTTEGRGVYVGDTLTIMNPVAKWWGEGDEKIFVDGEDFPSIFGTGTEDYYAYSWGGRSTDFYEHPFHAQPLAHKYNKLNRKTDSNERNTMGYSVETRTRMLDTMPFGSSLQLDMEVWSGTDCEMGYGVGVYWYGFADTASNRKPEPQEVRNVPPLPDEMK
ncbi:glycoside hydrolase family 172 protein [Pelagicoccus sp. SDUM812005]|uniref:glycoside hydrolase family 172 protein n=1 Tax=Pelagicoccus sp. SDUM812005 TaxID=3041257 RepID=UPI0031BB999C